MVSLSSFMHIKKKKRETPSMLSEWHLDPLDLVEFPVQI